MIKKIHFFFFCIILASCSNQTAVKIPDTVLSKEKMAAILLDIHLMEASRNITGASPNKIDLAGSNIALNLDVLKKHTITKKQYDDSFAFYTNHPLLLSEVYQLVLNDLSKMQAERTNSK